jgi:hypothetical protein
MDFTALKIWFLEELRNESFRGKLENHFWGSFFKNLRRLNFEKKIIKT